LSFVKIQLFERQKWVSINLSKIKVFKSELFVGRQFRILVDDEVIYHSDKNGVLKEEKA
jgi:hypothetical protein